MYKRQAEKQVISNKASAGCYLFASLDVFLKAAATAVLAPDTYCYKGLYYMCPVYNAVIEQGHFVRTIMAQDVVDVREADAG